MKNKKLEYWKGWAQETKEVHEKLSETRNQKIK